MNDLLLALNAAAEIARRVDSSEDSILQAVGAQLTRLQLRGGICLLTASGDQFVVRLAALPAPTLAELEQLSGLRLTGYTFPITQVQPYHQALTTQQTLFVPDGAAVVEQLLPAAARALTGPIGQILGHGPVILAPLVWAGQVLGVLDASGAGLTPDDVPVLTALADHIAMALANARLYQAGQQRLQRLKALQAITTALNRASGLDEALSATLTETLAAFGLGAGWISLRERPDADGFWLAARAGLPPTLADGAVGRPEALCACQQRLLVSPWAPATCCADCDWLLGLGVGFASHAVVPLHAGGQLAGLLNLALRRGDTGLDEDDLAGLTTVGQQLAATITRLRAPTATDESLAREQRLNQLTRTLSSTLDLPATLQNTVRLAAELVEAALRRSEEKYRGLFNSLEEGVAINEQVLDEQGDVVDYLILDANPAFGKQSPYPAAAAVGQRATVLYQMPADYIREWWRGHADFQEPAHTEFLDAPSGRWFHVVTTPPDERRFATIFTDITGRKRAETALRTSEAQLRAVLDNSYDAIGVHINEVWEMCNPAALKLFGVPSAADLLGHSILGVIAPSEHERIRAFVRARAAGDEAPTTYVTRGRRADGVEFDMDVSLANYELAGQHHVLVMLRDITERQRAAAELNRKNRALLTLSACNLALVQMHDEQELLRAVCQACVEQGGYRMAWVGYAQHDDGQTVRPMAQAGFEAGYLDHVKISWADNEYGRGPTGTAIRTGQAKALRHLTRNPAYAPWQAQAARRGYDASIALPLTVDGVTLDALNIYSAEPEAFEAEEVGLLMEVAGNLAYGLAALRSQAQRQEAEAALRASEARFRALIEQAPVAIYLSRGGLGLYGNAKFMELVGLPSAEAIAGCSNADYFTPEARAANRERVERRAQGLPVASVFETVGRRTDGTRFPAIIETGTVQLADGPAIISFITDITERRRIEAAEREQRRLAEALRDTAQALNSLMDPDELLGQILANVGHVVPSDASSIILVEGDLARVARIALRPGNHDNYRPVGHAWPIEELPDLREMWQTGRPVCIPDTVAAADWRRFTGDDWNRSYIGAPIRVRGAVLGFISLHSNTAGFYQPKQAEDLLAFADQAATALENARLLAETRRRLKELTESEARFSRMFASSPIPNTLGRLSDGVFLDTNDAFLRMSGYNRDEVIGHSATELGIYPDPDARVKLLQAFRETGHAASQDQPFRTKSGVVVDTMLWLDLITIGGEACILALGLDVTEQKQADVKLRQLSRAVEQSPATIVITDVAGNIQYVNPKFTEVTGYSLEEALGQNPRILKSGETPPEVYQRLWAAISTGREWRGEFHNRKKNGELFWESAIISPIVDASGRLTNFLAVKEDITERRAAEAALRGSERRYHGLFAGSPIAMWEEDLSAVRQRLAALRQAGVADVAAYLAQHPEFAAECAALIKVIDVNSAALKRYGAVSQEELAQNLSKTFAPETYQTFRDELIGIAAGQSEFHYEGVNHTLAGEELRVNLGWSALPGHEHDLERVIVSMVDVTERARAEAALKQRLDELEAVNRVSTALGAAQRLDEMLPRLLAEAVAIVGGSAGGLWLYEPVADELWLACERGWGSIEHRFKRGEGVPGHVVATGQAYQSRDLKNDPHVPEANRERIPAGTGGICVPIRAADEISGALYVTALQPREFSLADAHLLTTLAEIAGNAMHRMRLHEQTERRLRQLTALRAIDMAISSSLDLPITLSVLVDHVLAQLQVDVADVLLLDAPRHTLVYAAGRGFRVEPVGHPSLTLGQGYAGRIALDRRLVALPEGADEAPHAAQLPPGEGIRAYYGVPLISNGQVAGVLEVYHRSPLRPDSDWLEFLEALAAQAAIAIDNARLFADLQRSNFDLSQAYEATIEGWSRALDLRDKETEGHSQRVTALTLRLAVDLGMQAEQLVHVRRGALLHDIGKMGVPDRILLKPGPLTDDEWVVMRLHPQFAHNMLAPIEYLRPALDIPYSHHEKWDGTGYPQGLAGEHIPLAARIFAVVDVWDALRSERPYRPAWPPDKVRAYIQAMAGSHFDPRVAAAALGSDLLRESAR